MRATVLVLVETINDYVSILEDQGYDLIMAPSPAARVQAIAEHSDRIDAVLTRGPLGLTADEMASLPRLRIICVLGAGYENVDLPAAKAHGLTVTNGAGVNASSVADHTLALLLAVMRDIPGADASVRRSEWVKIMRPSIAGKRLGILGLGAVGLAIAKRAALGFDMTVRYCNRRYRCTGSARPARLFDQHWPRQRRFHCRPARCLADTKDCRCGAGCLRRRTQRARCVEAPGQCGADAACGGPVARSHT